MRKSKFPSRSVMCSLMRKVANMNFTRYCIILLYVLKATIYMAKQESICIICFSLSTKTNLSYLRNAGGRPKKLTKAVCICGLDSQGVARYLQHIVFIRNTTQWSRRRTIRSFQFRVYPDSNYINFQFKIKSVNSKLSQSCKESPLYLPWRTGHLETTPT